MLLVGQFGGGLWVVVGEGREQARQGVVGQARGRRTLVEVVPSEFLSTFFCSLCFLRHTPAKLLL